ncbi:aminotransferase class I/II-fold pyridoxal phosphate-dependent enzyme [Ekhidna sp.]|uniref:aminotransferase class I/II-fold pyridoxal phosphate-dependent enzyme n=1 Tax=Ekhidna sp. TaxID=2608089 RepID=UPI003CCBC44E
MNNKRIYLSPPNVDQEELDHITAALESGWVAPAGPLIDQFESNLSSMLGREALALNSGTSALHLALILSGVRDRDRVLIGSHTFAACANVVLYERAVPVFLDSERETWNLDPATLEAYLENTDEKPKALIVTHIYGMPAQIEKICEIAKDYDVKVIEDAAESLGATVNRRQVGTFGDFGVLSFNGNKIITTSAGGALICSKEDKVRGMHLATQANSDQFGYDHKEAGYNYRMSNVLAAIGVSQLKKLESYIAVKRIIYKRYKAELNNHFHFPNEPMNHQSNRWLSTALTLDSSKDMQSLCSCLDENNIEARRFWKPLHMHDAYASAEFVGKGVCERLYESGICLPSGTGMTEQEQLYVIEKVKDWLDQ